MPNKKIDTIALHAGQETPDPTTGSRAVPIYQTSSYRVQKHRARSKLVCSKRIRKHLHQNNEPHNRRFRKKSSSHRRRNRRIGRSIRTSSNIPRTTHYNPSRRRNRCSKQPLRRNLQPTPLHLPQICKKNHIRRLSRNPANSKKQ